uniref:Uncharacterized protein n=1 Tax=Nelumbo nucifera TaxID=4432 RepID=A0A822ZQV1_NELNU|nr:TPA_asm: hypothetical protein HUJ06_002428 [Nelumbo nucifera]
MEGFSLAASVSSKPPAVFSSASATLINTRSFRGLRSLMSSDSRIPTISSSFNKRWFDPLNSSSVPAYLEYTI